MVPFASIRRLRLLILCFAVLRPRATAGPMNAVNEGSPANSLSDMLANGPQLEQGTPQLEQGTPQLEQGTNPMSGANFIKHRAKGGREAELDDLLSSVLRGTTHNDPKDQAWIGPQEGGVSGAGPAGVANSRSSIPGALLRYFFPGQLGQGAITSARSQPFSALDPFIMNILQDMDRTVANDVIPKMHAALSQDRSPNSCEQDIKSKCRGAKSHLHCLGYNHDTISKECRKDVGHLVPFLCSQAIDKWCDVLETGIMSCLRDHMKSLDGKCQEAVLTTEQVIQRVNTQKASMVDPTSGRQTITATSGAMGTASEHEAILDVKLGIAGSAKPFFSETTSNSAAKAKLGDATVMQNTPMSGSRPVAALVNSDSQSSLCLVWREVNVALLFLTIIGMLAYNIASQRGIIWSKVKQMGLVHQMAPEGVKLIADVELLETTDVAAELVP